MQTQALTDFLAHRADAKTLLERGHAAAVAVARQGGGNRLEAIRDTLAAHAMAPANQAVEAVLHDAKDPEVIV